MAYNSYGYNYQQPYQYQQNYQPMYNQPSIQPVQQQPNYQNVQAVQPTQQSQQQTNIIWITGGEKEAMLFPVAPNTAVTLWSASEPVVYLKQADASGKPTMKTYDLVERVETPPTAPSDGGDKKVEYALKSDLSAVVGVVKSFDDMLSSIKADVDAMKGDVYGLAGKKRTAKKPARDEQEDED